MTMHMRHTYSAIYLCIFLGLIIHFADAGKKEKLAKNILKGGVLKGIGTGKHYRSPHVGRMFPIWAIVLLVIGASGLVGLGIFLYCFFCRQFSQTRGHQRFV